MLERRPFFHFSETDHEVWRLLYARQYPFVKEMMSQPYYLHGLETLGITGEVIPDFAKVSQRLQDLVGWELFSTDEVFSDGQTWFEHLSVKQFLISEYIRDKTDLDYTPLPDIFHDAFGHLPLMATRQYTDLVYRYSYAMLECAPEKRKGLGSIWWYTIEFGMIEEDGKIKGLGAGLASSHGELEYAFSGKVELAPFNPEEIAQVKPSPHAYHNKLWVLESFEQLEAFVDDWVTQGKGAPEPVR